MQPKRQSAGGRAINAMTTAVPQAVISRGDAHRADDKA